MFKVHISLSNLQKLFLASGFGIIVLGFANIIYGQQKTEQYLAVLSSSTTLPSYYSEANNLTMLEKYLPVDNYRDHLARIKSRVEFYEFSIIGGKFFLVIGGIFLLFGVFSIRKSQADIPSSNLL
ncbi:MAG: hypothetical protein SGJ02_01470 [bacterium]|nr:hypothetical protein [bacterium]